MKYKYLIPLLLAVITFLPIRAAKDPDDYHVKIVLADGDTIEGYIRNDLKTGLKNLFSKTGSIRQYVNFRLDSVNGETKRYNAKEIKEYRFVEPTEGYPEGKACVSELIHQPSPFKRSRYVTGLAWELDKRDSGKVLRWDVFESTGGRNSVVYLVPAIGIRLKGLKAAYLITANGKFNDFEFRYNLKKKYPEFHKAWLDYYHKGPDAKAHRKEFSDNPSTALLFYEDYLLTNPPLHDEEDSSAD
ncbi:MAG: hypothetical protein HDS31_04995 [Bacteroides sp.]|nr:hypothetical protein [Bacteroides sp.]